MRWTRRQFVATAGMALAPTLIGSSAVAAPKPATTRVAGVYQQITADGNYINPRFGGVQGLLAFAALVDATGAGEHRDTFAKILEFLDRSRPAFMTPEVGVQILHSDFLRSHPRMMEDLESFVTELLDSFEADPNSLLRQGQIRNLSGSAEMLVAFADHLERVDTTGREHAAKVKQIRRLDNASVAMLDRLVDLQFTHDEAVTVLGNGRWTGTFPHMIDGADGNMGDLDVSTWSPAMLSLNQYKSIRALAAGFGRHKRAAYERAAAAASRIILSTDSVDPDLVYAGDPAGFPLDGADFVFGDETGEHAYVVSYGWSPNAIAEIGAAAQSLHNNGVTVSRSRDWIDTYWTTMPPESVLDPDSYRGGLLAKVAHSHDFVQATQLPVPADFPWIDLERASYAGTGDDGVRRGGWYDGSGRGTMSASYSQIMLSAYVETGGRDASVLARAAEWWHRMIVWEQV